MLLIELRDGFLKKGESIVSCGFKKRYEVFEVGILSPEMTQCDVLTAGQVGYAITNMKAASEARVGDTFYKSSQEVQPLPGFQEAKPMVYCGVYPEDPDQFSELSRQIFKLGLTDPAVKIQKESSASLGNGFRCGFLGILHMEVFIQRLEDEYEISTIVTSPSVPYKCVLRKGKVVEVENALFTPNESEILHYEEPFAKCTIITPKEFQSNIMKLCEDRRGVLLSAEMIDGDRLILKVEVPLSEVITNFFDKMKSLSQGYASMDYELSEYKKSNIIKLVIYLMNEPIDALSFLVH